MINQKQLNKKISSALDLLRGMFEINESDFKRTYASRIDHIAFIVQSSEKYNQVVNDWLIEGYKEYFTDFAGGDDEETGTKIGVYEITKPINVGESSVKIVEIIMPNMSKRKNDDSFKFDHFEISIHDKEYQEFMNEFPNVNWLDHKANRAKYPHLFIEGIDNLKFVQGSILDNM